jgi:hypothetical protein
MVRNLITPHPPLASGCFGPIGAKVSRTVMRRRMIAMALVISMGVNTPTLCHAQVACTTKDCNDRQIVNIKDLPSAILDLLSAQSGGRIADRGEPYNEVDVVVAELPCRRFKSAALGSERAVVRLEVGCLYGGPTLRWFWFKKSGNSWIFTGDDP